MRIIKPKVENISKGYYHFSSKTKAFAHRCLVKNVFKHCWKGFCCQAGDIEFSFVDDLTITIGQGNTVECPESGYALQVTENGISIAASSEKNLIYGYFALLERIQPISTKENKEEFIIECCSIIDDACIKTRMAHLCVFPETKLDFIQKFLRTAAFMRYTHIIVEFWGMLQFDCMQELAWPNAYTKEEIRPIFQEAKDMGLELVPMFNHWGHATASRVAQGKHVVLDQNIKLAPFFDTSGWNWNLENKEVRDLQKEIREELIDLFGDGEYFHIGCDEPYGNFSKEHYGFVADYINSVEQELSANGRKTIMWGDMLLWKDALEVKTNNAYDCLSPNEEVQAALLGKLSRNILVGDWQYKAKSYPIETAVFLKEQGFEVLSCPWDRTYENLLATSETVKKNNLKGVLHTTWHNLAMGMGCFGISATLAWEQETVLPSPSYYKAYLANIIRKLHSSEGVYEKTGWAEKQIADWLF